MEYYAHDLSRVEDHLHHRPPYLMVDRILDVSTDAVRSEKRITGEEFFLAGHFPGAPIFPGAMMQEFSTQSAGILIAAKYNPMPEFNTSDPHFNSHALGVLVKVMHARYKRFARPGDVLTAEVTLKEHTDSLFDFNARILVEDQVIMKNSFRLANVLSATLVG